MLLIPLRCFLIHLNPHSFNYDSTLFSRYSRLGCFLNSRQSSSPMIISLLSLNFTDSLENFQDYRTLTKQHWKFSQKTNHSFLFCFKFFRELWADVWSGGSLYFPKSIGGHIIYLMYSYIYLSEFVLKWIEFMAMFMVESNAAFAWEKSMKRFVNEDSWLHLRRDKRNHYYAKMSFWNTILPPYILTTHSTKSYPINITQLTSFAGEKMN